VVNQQKSKLEVPDLLILNKSLQTFSLEITIDSFRVMIFLLNRRNKRDVFTI